MTVVAALNEKNADLAQIGMADINRIRWRCRRGMLELDMVLARFLDERIVQLTESQWQEFESLIALEDQQLWRRITDVGTTTSIVEQLLQDCRIAGFADVDSSR